MNEVKSLAEVCVHREGRGRYFKYVYDYTDEFTGAGEPLPTQEVLKAVLFDLGKHLWPGSKDITIVPAVEVKTEKEGSKIYLWDEANFDTPTPEAIAEIAKFLKGDLNNFYDGVAAISAAERTYYFFSLYGTTRIIMKFKLSEGVPLYRFEVNGEELISLQPFLREIFPEVYDN